MIHKILGGEVAAKNSLTNQDEGQPGVRKDKERRKLDNTPRCKSTRTEQLPSTAVTNDISDSFTVCASARSRYSVLNNRE